jgi:hypothetical protein
VAALLGALRPSVAYVTVNQNDEGLSVKELPMAQLPNVLVLSAGGYGHVPVRHSKSSAKRLQADAQRLPPVVVSAL